MYEWQLCISEKWSDKNFAHYFDLSDFEDAIDLLIYDKDVEIYLYINDELEQIFSIHEILPDEKAENIRKQILTYLQ